MSPTASSGKLPPWAERMAARLIRDAEFHGEFLQDLEVEGVRRFGDGLSTGLRARVWLLRQILSPSVISLSRSLRARKRRPSRDRPIHTAQLGIAERLAVDLSHAVRGLRRSLPFTASASISLALGIGATVSVFSVAAAVLLRPLPYQNPHELVFVWNQMDGSTLARVPMTGFQIGALREQDGVFADAAGIWATTMTVRSDDRTALAATGLVTPNFFELLGISPVLGAGFFMDGPEVREDAILLSHRAWVSDFGADSSLIGSSVVVEGFGSVVAGVLPADFSLHFPDGSGVPNQLDLFVVLPWTATTNPNGNRYLRTVARLAPGTDPATADAAAKQVARGLRDVHPIYADGGDDFRVVPLHEDAVERARPALIGLSVAAGLFLLLSAFNVAGLLMARMTRRQSELSIRRSIGASVGDLTRLVVVEGVCLAAIGILAGLLLSVIGVTALWELRPPSLTAMTDAPLTWQVVQFALATAALAGLVALAGPVLGLAAGRAGPIRMMAGDRITGMPRGRRLVVIVETAISLILVLGAGMMWQTLAQLEETDLGFTTDGQLTFRVGLSRSLFPEDAERALLADRIEQEITDLPGVSAVGATSHLPLADWANYSGSASPVGTPEAERELWHFDHRSVSVGYREAMGLRLVAGRDFRSDDLGDGEPVIIIDRTLAERAFPGEDPIDQVLHSTRYLAGAFDPVPARVVGVVDDVRDRGPAAASTGQVLWPFAQAARWELTFVVRGAGDLADLAPAIRAAVRGVNADLAAADFQMLESFRDRSLATERLSSRLAGTFSGLALLLAGVGLFGLISYATSLQVRRFGIQLALGADRRSLFLGVLRDGVGMAAIGVALGLAGAFALKSAMGSVLVGLRPLTPGLLLPVISVLFVVALVATAGPAFRTSRVDPLEALRGD